ncbi:hypothetical protein ABPG75_003171 [Micractinium tetrahymenae]
MAGQAPGLLDLPGDGLAAIAACLPLAGDRANLAAACSRLLACSRWHSAAWWGSLHVTLWSNEQTAALGAWLAAQRPGVRRLAVQGEHYDTDEEEESEESESEEDEEAEEEEGGEAEQEAAGSSDGSSDVGHSSEEEEAPWGGASGGYLRGSRTAPLAVSLPSPPLPALTDLVLSWHTVGAAQLSAILAHTQLTRLQLCACGLAALPRAMHDMAALRHLDLSLNHGLAVAPEEAAGWHHLPPGLTHLDLSTRALRAIPAAVARLHHLRCLVLGHSFLGLVDPSRHPRLAEAAAEAAEPGGHTSGSQAADGSGAGSIRDSHASSGAGATRSRLASEQPLDLYHELYDGGRLSTFVNLEVACGWGHLAALGPSLTRLDLRGAHWELPLPAQLGALSRLRELNLGFAELGPGVGHLAPLAGTLMALRLHWWVPARQSAW